MADAVNPYLPDQGQQLAMMLMALGGGITSASAAGRPGWEGIAPGAMSYGAALSHAQQQALQADRYDKQYGEQQEYRRAQEDNLRSQADARKREIDMDERLMKMLPGMGGPAAAPASTSTVPGFNVPAAQPTIGPPADLLRDGAPKVAYLTQNYGLSPVAAAGVVGGLYQESGFKPNAVGDGGTAVGQAQWRGDRAAGLVQFAAGQNKAPTDPQVQLDYLMKEMKGGDMGAQRAYAMLQQAKTPDDATMAMMHFFRPAGYTPNAPQGGDAYGRRVQYAQALLPNGQPVPQGDGGPPGSPGAPQPPAYAQPTVPRVDPLTYAPFTLSKRLAPFGKAMMDYGNSELTRGLEERKFQQQIDQDAEKRQQFERTQTGTERNAAVGPDGRPNQAKIDADAAEAAARAKAEADAKLDSTAATSLVTHAVTEFVNKERPKALALQETIPELHNIRRLVDAGAITGTGTETRNALAQLGSTLGFTSNEAALTPAYLGAMAEQIVANAKALGVNPSNRDAEIIKQAKGANPNTSKEGVLKLLDVQEGIMRQAHDRYIAEAKRVQGLRGVKQAYGDDYFMLPKPPTYEEWSTANPLQQPNVRPEPPSGFRVIAPGQGGSVPPPPAGFRRVQ